MNKILLINRTDPQDYSEERKKVFFSIGGMNIKTMENKIIGIFQKCEFVKFNDLVFKYNGIEINITTQKIPQVIKMLSEEDIYIYNVFQLYNPDL